MTGSPGESSADDGAQRSQLLARRIARALHESRCRERAAAGWRHGLQLDESARTDPRLGDYEVLDESEKSALLREALLLLDVLDASGCRVLGSEETAVSEQLDSRVLATMRFRELLDLFHRHRDEWRASPRNFLLLGEALLQRSEPVLAFEVFQAGNDAVEHAVQRDQALHRRLLQKSAQALADARALHDSERILAGLYATGARDGETMGLWAKVHKRIAIETGEARALEMALRLYREGFETAERERMADDAIYNGINAATMARLAGDRDTSARILARVRELCLEKSERSYWDDASLGECSLLEGDMESARHWYALASAAAPLRDRLSMWQQLSLIRERLGLPDRGFRQLFAPPRIVVFCGHRLDAQNSGFERFPPSRERQIRERIREHLDAFSPGFAYCSAMCGSDILFIEEMLARDAEVHVFLPFPAPQFAAEYVAYAGEAWLERFRGVLGRVASVSTVSQWDIGLNDKSHAFCNLYLFGAALLHHQRSGCELRGLAVWDGVEDSANSGTAASIAMWKAYGIDWESIHVAAPAHIAVGADHGADDEDAESGESRHVCLPMMFADVKGYSRLGGLQLYIFAQRFMRACAAVVQRHHDRVFSTRTQGDSLFIVFRDFDAAISVARDLRDMIASTDWEKSGLPAGLSARIALDCGPCYAYPDPVTGRTELCGAHVIRAARLEPVTPPGQIYVSEGFAAVCAAQKIEAGFEAAGRILLPKGFGEMRVYHLD